MAHLPSAERNSDFGSLHKFAEIWSLSWSPDNKFVATASEDQKTRIWYFSFPFSVSFSPHSSLILIKKGYIYWLYSERTFWPYIRSYVRGLASYQIRKYFGYLWGWQKSNDLEYGWLFFGAYFWDKGNWWLAYGYLFRYELTNGTNLSNRYQQLKKAEMGLELHALRKMDGFWCGI